MNECFSCFSIYGKYVNMIESVLGGFQEREGLSNHEFKDAFEAMEKMNPMMIKLILCTWEFGYFLEICQVRSRESSLWRMLLMNGRR